MSESAQPINRLYQVFSDVLGVSVQEINEDSSPDTIASWDSMTHINLVLALEAEFHVSLSPEDAMEILSVKLARIILTEKGVLLLS